LGRPKRRHRNRRTFKFAVKGFAKPNDEGHRKTLSDYTRVTQDTTGGNFVPKPDLTRYDN
jgi:hypothetical protein